MEHRLELRVLESELGIARLAPDAAEPDWACGEFVSVTRTAEELSVVRAMGAVPAGLRVAGPWRALVVKGPIDFALTGVLNSLTGPLAGAGVGIFAISTFDTDYLLVQSGELGRAVEVLGAAGHLIAESGQKALHGSEEPPH
jgi:uncharacterized protein